VTALVATAAAAAVQETSDAAAADAEATRRPRFLLSVEAKAHYRDSDANRFPSPFPFPVEHLPPGRSQPFLETVDPGSSFEVSTATLLVDAAWGDVARAHAKIDLLDLHDRNPTSTDKKFDVDEAWVRFGGETEPGALPERGGGYIKVGKFGHFERQDDRHLESYGLAATAFNRFEDQGVEAGFDVGRFLYLKASATQGNPLFLRDPNALAGDNGTPERRRTRPDTVPELGSGVVILYDAEVEDPDFGGDLELGAGIGVRLTQPEGTRSLDLLLWGYERTLAARVPLEGTFYGGDLDLLDGPVPGSGLPIRGDRKREVGANLWLYWGGLSVFGQWVEQEVAGMDRSGREAEAAWRFELPLVWALGGRQLFPSIAPALRWSKLEPEFDGGSAQFPAPSLRWEWRKLDYGVRLGIVAGLDLTVEVADHEFILGSGAHRDNDELLTTLHWRR
jgi:hypothetical protein